jgi:hypothetical protein
VAADEWSHGVMACRIGWMVIACRAGLVLSACGVGWLGRVSPDGSFAFGIFVPSILASVGLGICFAAIASATTSRSGMKVPDR